MAAPTNVKGVHRFLSLTKHCQFQWNAECERAFQTLKACLSLVAILAYPDLTKPYILYTYASDTCIGSVLMQQHEHNGELIEKPVFYYSVQLHDAQICWSPVVKEAYAIHKSVLKLKSCIENCEVLVKSDHKPLKKYFTDSIQNTKIDSWSLTLQEFNLKFMWIAGAANKADNFMSRLYSPTDDKQSADVLDGIDVRSINTIMDITSAHCQPTTINQNNHKIPVNAHIILFYGSNSLS